jgi:hypothetical protein
VTVNYKLDAMLDLRKYLWDQLQTAGIFDPDDYDTTGTGNILNPIIPVQQPAEFNQFLSGKKHIVYDKINLTYEDNWMICNEQILFTIYAIDVADINEITNFMVDLFRRMDDSARDINFSDQASPQFKFYNTYVADISPTTPSKELQGFLSSDVIVEIKYSRILDQNGRYA